MNYLETINQFVLYTGDDGDVKLKLFLEDETLWLSQKLIGELFQVESHTINYHIKDLILSNIIKTERMGNKSNCFIIGSP